MRCDYSDCHHRMNTIVDVIFPIIISFISLADYIQMFTVNLVHTNTMNYTSLIGIHLDVIRDITFELLSPNPI